MVSPRLQPGISALISAIGHFAVKRAGLIISLSILCTLALVPAALNTQYDDDVIKFLPEGDPEVQRFREIGTRFQGLSVGIIGVEAEEGDLFDLKRLKTLRKLTRKLRDVPGVGSVTSVTGLRDVEEEISPVGESVAVIGDLIGELPEGKNKAAALQFSKAIRAKVLSRDHIRGALISESGKASLILCNIQPEAELKKAADQLRLVAEGVLSEEGSDLRLYFGGAPFVGAFVSDGTRADMGRLFPFVALAILFILLVTSRSLPGALIALSAVGVCIAWTMGLMSLFGHKLTLVSSSLPVLLVALGSAYSIHLLARVFSNLDQGISDKKKAVLEAVQSAGPPIAGAGLTTALGFLSFQVMDIQPMRSFGLWMAGSTLLIVAIALLVVPAACIMLPLKGRDSGRAPNWALALMCGAAGAVINRGRLALFVCLTLAASSAYFTSQLTTNVDTRHLFEEGSEPINAEDFFQEHLGGSRFLQVEIEGNIKDPMVLRQIERFATFAAAQEGVSDVQSVVTPMALGASALSGEKRIPAGIKATQAIAALVDEDPNLRLLVDPTWSYAIVQIKLKGFDSERSSELAETLKLEGNNLCGRPRASIPRSQMNAAMKEMEQAEVVSQIQNILQAEEQRVPSKKVILRALGEGSELSADPATLASMLQAVEKQLRADIEDDEMVYLIEGADLSALSRRIHSALVKNELKEETMLSIISEVADEEEKSDMESLKKANRYLYENQKSILVEQARSARLSALNKTLESPLSTRLKTALLGAISVLDDALANLPAQKAEAGSIERKTDMSLQVSGYPRVYSGMVSSVHRNQTRSLALSFLLIVFALIWFFNSWKLGLIASIPAGFTLLATFGIMGFFKIPMDVGTSMLSSVALGVGIDYAVHLLWKHGSCSNSGETPSLKSSFEATGWGIVINALAVTAGFAILSFGTIMPMKYFGVLTAFAMLGSACTTLLLIPALTQWVRHENP